MAAKIAPLLFMFGGASCCVLGFYLWYRNKRLAATGFHATGLVVRWVEAACHSDMAAGAPRVMYAPVVKFTALDARTIEFTDSSPCGDVDRYKIGQEVRVLYDRRDFSHACIDTGTTRNAGPFFVLVLGLVFLVLGYVGYVTDIHRR